MRPLVWTAADGGGGVGAGVGPPQAPGGRTAPRKFRDRTEREQVTEPTTTFTLEPELDWDLLARDARLADVVRRRVAAV